MDMSTLVVIGVILFVLFILVPAIVASFLRNVEAGTIRMVSWLHGAPASRRRSRCSPPARRCRAR
jgi:hypothetical protein